MASILVEGRKHYIGENINILKYGKKVSRTKNEARCCYNNKRGGNGARQIKQAKL